MTDWSHDREIAEAGGRMPFNAAAILAMLDAIDRAEAEREDARRWAVRLEGELARAKEAMRSQEILRERAVADRDTALGRLAICISDVAAYRHQLRTAVAARSEAVTALGEPLPPCDWGDCDEPSVTTRYDDVSRAWLPVCEDHRR